MRSPQAIAIWAQRFHLCLAVLDARCIRYAQTWGYEKRHWEILQQRCPIDLLVGKFAVPVANIASGFDSSVRFEIFPKAEVRRCA